MMRSLLSAALVFAISGCGPQENLVDDEGGTSGEDTEPTSGLETVEQELPATPAGYFVRSCGQNTPCSWNGVTVYQKNWPGGVPDYVTVVNLGSARIKNLQGAVTNVAGECDQVNKKSLGVAAGSFWGDAFAADNTVRVVVNGAFFATASNPTGIAFGLKTAGSSVSTGYAVNGPCRAAASEFPGSERLFSFSSANSRAWIQNYDRAIFADATKPDVIGGLAATCCKSPASYTNRTAVGIRDDNGDGRAEILFIFSSSSAMLSGNWGADDTLSRFGATARMQLDGGGSTGLIVNGSTVLAAGRQVPNAVAIYTGR